jgi:hypothetical protein
MQHGESKFEKRKKVFIRRVATLNLKLLGVNPLNEKVSVRYGLLGEATCFVCLYVYKQKIDGREGDFIYLIIYYVKYRTGQDG